MKKTLILIMCAALQMFVACQKNEAPKKASIEIAVSEVSTQNANVSVTTQGPKPYLVRMTAAVLKDEFLSKVETMTNDSKIIAYANKYGSAIVVPYTTIVKDLNPDQDYVIAVISYNENLDALAWDVVEFKTAPVGSVVVGDASGAGSVTENELEKKPVENE